MGVKTSVLSSSEGRLELLNKCELIGIKWQNVNSEKIQKWKLTKHGNLYRANILVIRVVPDSVS